MLIVDCFPSATLTPPLSPAQRIGLTALSAGLEAKPTLTLSFYHFGILLHRMTEDGGEVEYAVGPAQLADALSVRVRFETGLLSGDTLYILHEGPRKTIVEYRSPQKTALYLEGSDTPIIVPLPGLVMGRVTTGGSDSPRYSVYAVKQRPDTLDTPLFHAPLPNVGHNSVCWGTVRRVSAEALATNSLQEDFRLLLGSAFTSHSVSGKSKRWSDDIRKAYLDLEQRKARKYPVSDLVSARLTFGEWLGRLP